MPKGISTLELTLGPRQEHVGLNRWLIGELRRAVLDHRLPPGARLPATRDFAQQHGVSRGTVVTAYEQLQAEGYLIGTVGAGTRVSELLPGGFAVTGGSQHRRGNLPTVVRGLPTSHPARPFRPYEPALTEFPMDIWGRVSGRRLRRANVSLLARGDPRGYAPLREAIAAYLGSSRGVNCSAETVVIVSGVQQGLDLTARLLLKPGDPVWMEDPGYFGAAAAFRAAGAKIIPVPVDACGVVVSKAKEICLRAKAAYVTPAHQFPLGASMSLDRRLALLAWARAAGAYVIEDDYDSEFRFQGLPIPALQGLAKDDSVVFLGSFNKILFPALRMGYVVVPSALLDSFLALRLGADLYPSNLNQAVLCDFIEEGHLARHIRRMREMYAVRLGALQESAHKYLRGLLDISPIQAGLCTAGLLQNGIKSRHAETLATEHGVEALGFHRFTRQATSVEGLLLGFAAFTEREIRRGAITLAAALGKTSAGKTRTGKTRTGKTRTGKTR